MIRFLICCVFLTSSALAQDRFADVEVTAEAVRGPIHVLKGAGGNIGVSVGDDGILLVDDQFAPLADKIKAALADLKPGPVQFIINTHWHGDHTGGNADFGDAVILSHDNVRKRLMEGNEKTDPAAPEAWPVITFDQSVTIHFNGEAIEILHFPHAHTDGDAVVFFTGSNVVHMGDLVFHGMYPFMDLDSGGNVAGDLAAVEQVLTRIDDATSVIVGHGATVVSKQELMNYRDFLKASVDYVAAGNKDGLTREAIMERGMPAGDWDAWEIVWITEDQWIGFVFDSLNPKD